MHQKLYGFLFRRSVRSDKVCTANMFTYHSTSLIPHITDIGKNNRNHSLISWEGTSSQHWQELKSTGVWGVKQVLLLVEPWDLSKSELYIEEYSTSERMITTWEPLCMNLERNIVSRGGGDLEQSHISRPPQFVRTWERSAAPQRRWSCIFYISEQFHVSESSHISEASHDISDVTWVCMHLLC